MIAALKIALLALAVSVAWYLFSWPDWAPFGYALAAICGTAVIADMAMRATSTSWHDAGSASAVVQGVAAMVTMCAVFVAGGIYFYQRQDRLRYAFSVETKVVDVGDTTPSQQVLLMVRVPIENKGARQLTLNCASLGLYGLRRNHVGALSRNDKFSEDLEMEPLVPTVRQSEQRRCLTAEESYRHWRPGSIHPFFMWTRMVLEPGESDDNYFETLVPCNYSLLRVLVKMRPDFAYLHNNTETKVIVPLADVCNGKAEARSTEVDSSLHSDSDGGPGARSGPSAAIGARPPDRAAAAP
ncbi:MAG: hypothetical protein B7Y45_11500 [Sphingomonas sp. 28-66-16]|nr:MAG: hypothetical protein B7Y45_11500 [Sphingomonas sp. 28-66-16]